MPPTTKKDRVTRKEGCIILERCRQQSGFAPITPAAAAIQYRIAE